MSDDRYQAPPTVPGALRLHLNENTGGCSPAVLEAVRRVTPQEMALYPDYSALLAECAAYFGVDASTIALLNGLDEGLLSAVIAAFRADPPHRACPRASSSRPPSRCTRSRSARPEAASWRSPRGTDFGFPLEEILEAVTPRTRILFLTSPNNPTGLLVPREAIRRLARELPDRVTIVLDEAYYEFCGETFLPELPAHPRRGHRADVRQGARAGRAAGRLPHRRTRAARSHPQRHPAVQRVGAHRGRLAGGAAGSRAPRAVPAGGGRVEGARLCALRPAGTDVLEERRQLRARANRRRRTRARRGLASRGVLIKDRSSEHGCQGCVRITAGIVEHTRKALAAMEESLCAAG